MRFSQHDTRLTHSWSSGSLVHTTAADLSPLTCSRLWCRCRCRRCHRRCRCWAACVWDYSKVTTCESCTTELDCYTSSLAYNRKTKQTNTTDRHTYENVRTQWQMSMWFLPIGFKKRCSASCRFRLSLFVAFRNSNCTDMFWIVSIR